ncbi:thioredoxin family protein [Leptolyngbya ohadii]|uniref:thioredoxin family protein n=1 Tax=Leptolyngbya ohadii TaxID=1962290 RepID=UPI000B59B9C0|nr:thioredoxin domain-containing protein [Leptolyngbya ohadii]
MMLTVNQVTFDQEVLGSVTPVLVNFWAPWCGVCRMIDPLLLELRKDWDDQIKLVSINADDNLKLSNTYKLKTLPTVLLFSQTQVLCRIDRFNNRSDFREASATLKAALSELVPHRSYSASV